MARGGKVLVCQHIVAPPSGLMHLHTKFEGSLAFDGSDDSLSSFDKCAIQMLAHHTDVLTFMHTVGRLSKSRQHQHCTVDINIVKAT
jgi:hypothetical protein